MKIIFDIIHILFIIQLITSPPFLLFISHVQVMQNHYQSLRNKKKLCWKWYACTYIILYCGHPWPCIILYTTECNTFDGMYSGIHSKVNYHNCILIWSYPLAGSYMLHMHGTCMSMIIIISGLHTSWIHKTKQCIMTDVQLATPHKQNCVAIFEPIKYATEYIPSHVWWLSWLPVSLLGGTLAQKIERTAACMASVFLHMHTGC